MAAETKSYRIRRPHFADGRYYRAGSVIGVPAGDKVPRYWTEISPSEAEAKPYVPMDPERPRQSDAPKLPKSDDETAKYKTGKK